MRSVLGIDHGGLTAGLPLWWPALIDVMNVIRCYRRDRSAWPLSLSPPSFLGPTEWPNNTSEWRAGAVWRWTRGPRKESRENHNKITVSHQCRFDGSIQTTFSVRRLRIDA